MAEPELQFALELDDYHQMGYLHDYHTWTMEWQPGETNTEYFNRIAMEITDDVEYRLGIHRWQQLYAPHIPIHPNFQILMDLAPHQETEEERMEDICTYAFPRPVSADDWSTHSDIIADDWPEETPEASPVLYFGIAIVTCVAAVIIYRLL